MTLDKQIADLSVQHAKDLAELILKDQIGKALPKLEGVKQFIHIYDLYGAMASVKYGDWHGDALDIADGITLLNQLKGTIVSRYYMKDSCLSLPPATHVESLSDRDLARYDSKPISSYIIKLEHNRACLEFYIDVPKLGLIEINMWFKTGEVCGTEKWHSTGIRDALGNMKEKYGGTHIFDTQSTIEHDLVHASLAAENPISWAQVAPEYEQRKTYYFTKHFELDPSPAEFLELSLQEALR